MIQHQGRSWLAVGGLLVAAALALSSPSSAATRTVTLTSNGPSPASITINAGDRVTFVNADNGGHTITDNAGPWSFRASIAPGHSASTPAFGAAGHYGYNDAFFVAVVQQNVDGAIEVRSAPSPKPTPKPTVKPTTKPTAQPPPSRTPSPAASASGTASPIPGQEPSPSPSVTATQGLSSVPVLTLPPTPGPTPAVAPPVVPPVGSPPATAAYGPVSEIVQPSAHRYGLPVLLALLAAAGVLSLLVRFLLAVPSTETAAARRTEGDGVGDSDAR